MEPNHKLTVEEVVRRTGLSHERAQRLLDRLNDPRQRLPATHPIFSAGYVIARPIRYETEAKAHGPRSAQHARQADARTG